MARTELEDEFALQLRLAGIDYQREVKVIPGRRFKWDFWITGINGKEFRDLLVEIQGGIWIKGGHTTGKGITRDAEKLNLAALAGFRSMQFTKEHIQSGQALKWVQEFLNAKTLSV
jgi:hypothetical protein